MAVKTACLGLLAVSALLTLAPSAPLSLSLDLCLNLQVGVAKVAHSGCRALLLAGSFAFACLLFYFLGAREYAVTLLLCEAGPRWLSWDGSEILRITSLRCPLSG